MPASQAIEAVIKEAQKMDPVSAEAYIEFYSQTFNHEIVMAEIKEKDRLSTKRIVGLSGLVGLVGILILVIFFQEYVTKWQAGIIWVGLCVFTAACCAVIPGFFNLEIKTWIKAGGALGIFIFMYLYKPVAMGEDFSPSKSKLKYHVANKDTSSITTISIDFIATSSKNICEFSKEAISEYYGDKVHSDTFTFFRKSDGKIYRSEKCNELLSTDLEIICLSKKILQMFRDEREAYDHFIDIANRKKTNE